MKQNQFIKILIEVKMRKKIIAKYFIDMGRIYNKELNRSP